VDPRISLGSVTKINSLCVPRNFCVTYTDGVAVREIVYYAEVQALSFWKLYNYEDVISVVGVELVLLECLDSVTKINRRKICRSSFLKYKVMLNSLIRK
jgi:hypothetical protein